jgi:hypothetical protein
MQARLGACCRRQVICSLRSLAGAAFGSRPTREARGCACKALVLREKGGCGRGSSVRNVCGSRPLKACPPSVAEGGSTLSRALVACLGPMLISAL